MVTMASNFVTWAKKNCIDRFKRAFLLALLISSLFSAQFSHAFDIGTTYDLQIPSTEASTALKVLARQTKHSLLFQNTEIESVTTNAISGNYTLEKALKLLLDGTNLSGGFTEGKVITISRLAPKTVVQTNQDTHNTDEDTPVLSSIANAFLSIFGASKTTASTSATIENESKVMVIVGSRAAPRSIGDSPVPVDVISSEELSANGSTDMIDMLTSAVPSFNSRTQPISDAASLVRPVNLRGLPSDSALILVNGKRRHRASVIAFQGGGINDGAQGPDISVIPSIALKQVEVLRDGAAAQYGSDAIAGVMNFILKDSSEGGSLSLKKGEFFKGDGNSTILDGNIGLPVANNGFANFSFQLKNSDGTNRSMQRPDAQDLINAGNSDVNNPAQIWGNPEIKDDITVFTNIGLELSKDKELYLFGNFSERDVTGGFYYRNPHNRGNVYSIDKGETLLVGDVGLATTGVASCQSSTGALLPSNVPIPIDPITGVDLNVLTTQAYQDMVADPNCFSMNMIPGYAGGYTPQFGGNVTDSSVTFGSKGEIKAGLLADWRFDLSGSVGRNAAAFNLKNTLNPSLGLDTPFDFDTGSYIQLEQTFNFDLVKGVDFGFAEDVNFATGVEWRKESFEIVAGEEASWIAGPYADQGFNVGSHGFKGFGPESQGISTRRNIGAYVDLEAYVDDFLVGAALRYEDFSSFGDTLDYKLTMQYAVDDEFSIRGSHSTGFRAPTVGQANVVNTQTSIVNGNLIQTFIAPPTNPLSAFYGGVELTPEESTSFAFGTVYESGDFFLTVDYYSIKVIDRLAQSSQIEVQDIHHAELEALGVENPELISAVTYYANDFDTTTSGLDVVANYSMDALGGKSKLSLVYNWNKTTVDSFNPETTSSGKVQRLEEGIPAHRATFTWAQNWNDINLFLRTNYFGEYYATHADDTTALGSETADSAFTFDAEVSYAVNNVFTLTAGANNLFDQEAQKLPASSRGVLGAIYYESGPLDYNGGYYYFKGTYTY